MIPFFKALISWEKLILISPIIQKNMASYMIIEDIRKYYDKSKWFIIINTWDNYFEGRYLEFDQKYGDDDHKFFIKYLVDIKFRNSKNNP